MTAPADELDAILDELVAVPWPTNAGAVAFDAAKPLTETSYSHPLTDEDKAKVDTLIESIKRKAKK